MSKEDFSPKNQRLRKELLSVQTKVVGKHMLCVNMNFYLGWPCGYFCASMRMSDIWPSLTSIPVICVAFRFVFLTKKIYFEHWTLYPLLQWPKKNLNKWYSRTSLSLPNPDSSPMTDESWGFCLRLYPLYYFYALPPQHYCSHCSRRPYPAISSSAPPPTHPPHHHSSLQLMLFSSFSIGKRLRILQDVSMTRTKVAIALVFFPKPWSLASKMGVDKKSK